MSPARTPRERKPFQVGKTRPWSSDKLDKRLRLNREREDREIRTAWLAHHRVAKFRSLARLSERGKLIDKGTEDRFRSIGDSDLGRHSRPREFGSKNIVKRLIERAYSTYTHYWWDNPERMKEYSVLLSRGPREVAIRVVKNEMKITGARRNPKHYSELRDFLSWLTFMGAK